MKSTIKKSPCFLQMITSIHFKIYPYLINIEMESIGKLCKSSLCHTLFPPRSFELVKQVTKKVPKLGNLEPFYQAKLEGSSPSALCKYMIDLNKSPSILISNAPFWFSIRLFVMDSPSPLP